MEIEQTGFHTYDRGETRVIVPDLCGDGVINQVEAILVNTDTGGFTKSYGIGAWRGEREDIIIYDVAGLSFDDLKRVANILLDSGQTDIYVRLPSGTAGWFDRRSQLLESQNERGQVEATIAPFENACRDIEAERRRERTSDVYA